LSYFSSPAAAADVFAVCLSYCGRLYTTDKQYMLLD